MIKRGHKLPLKGAKKRKVEGPGMKPITVYLVKKSNLKMARNLQSKHQHETDVAYAFSFSFGSKERKTLLESIRITGN